MRTFRTFLLAILLPLLLNPVAGSAQDDSRVSSIEIAIWPEYDRQAALVIYQVRLSDDADTVVLPVPASAGDPHAVAAWHSDGTLDDAVTWSANPQGEWTLIEVTTDTGGVWLEFYDEMTLVGAERSYTFSWPGELSTESLRFDVLHPVGAQDLQITPDGDVRVGSDGLLRTQLDLGARVDGQAYVVALSYSKPTAFTGERPAPRSNPAFAQFEVALWPEFDQPATLVIYRGELSPEVPLPATVAIPLPAAVGEPNAVAFIGSDNRLYSIEYERHEEGDWAWIAFETESRAIQLEYYDDLSMEGTTRTYTYLWPGVLETGSFTYELQQPMGAADFQVAPAGAVEAAADGLVYVRSQLGPQSVGSSLTINFQYTKSSSELTLNALESAPSIDRPATTQGGTPDINAQLPFILGGFGLALIVLGVFLYLRMRRQVQASRSRPRQRKRKPRSQRAGGDLDAAAVFCHVCGMKASASDHFCRGCGTKLRQ